MGEVRLTNALGVVALAWTAERVSATLGLTGQTDRPAGVGATNGGVSMKISTISVSGFRCLKKVEVEVEDYSVLIGANGSGKSSVLYALDWF